ncbi:hypothetical protein [Nocardia rhizosphaerihabitans]|uniref:Uncharacterized protein n=1 Tax=Nocardia rhizosphaerihabitans TaxID=1691570 RepID=A0ABQ2L192_9NOCA|nr:hypothetical protein [Nocardia rhizosphaerihabitans]GGN99042.1 hypothetical protein GCM10011610_66580 [Nocardia rhizosphaerihabitans]
MSELRLSAPFDGHDPEGKPVVNRPAVDPQIRDRVLSYLAHAPVVLSARSYAADDFDAQVRDVPMNFHTDGVFVWPGAVPHYLRKYGVPPEPALVQHIVGKNFEIGEVGEDARQAAVRLVVG